MAFFMAQPAIHADIVAPEETMEISSDAGRPFDNEDIDIDIEIGEYQNDTVQDDYMIEEDEGQDITNNDDVMFDENDGDQTIQEDGTMEDEFVIEDEELKDVEAQDLNDTEITGVQPDQLGAFAAVNNSEIALQQSDVQLTEPTADITLPNIDAPLPSDTTNNSSSIILLPEQTSNDLENQAITPEHKLNKDPALAEYESAERDEAKSSEVFDNLEEKEPTVQTHSLEAEAHAFASSQGKEDGVSEASRSAAKVENESIGDINLKENEEPEVKDDYGLHDLSTEGDPGSIVETSFGQLEAVSNHPVVIVYEDEEIDLFPRADETTDRPFFLEDRSLAKRPVSELVAALRSVLGADVGSDVILGLEFEQLALALSEDSRDVDNTTFAKILDLYVKLSQNDGVEHPDPLYIYLRTRTSFSSRLRELLDASENELGLSVMKPEDDSDYEEQPADIEVNNGREHNERPTEVIVDDVNSKSETEGHSKTQSQDEASNVQSIENTISAEVSRQADDGDEAEPDSLQSDDHEEDHDAAVKHDSEHFGGDQGPEDELLDLGEPEVHGSNDETGDSKTASATSLSETTTNEGVVEVEAVQTTPPRADEVDVPEHYDESKYSVEDEDLDEENGALHGEALNANETHIDQNDEISYHNDDEDDISGELENNSGGLGAEEAGEDWEQHGYDDIDGDFEEENAEVEAEIATLEQSGNDLHSSVDAASSALPKQVLSRKRSRDETGFEEHALDDNTEAKKAKPA